MTQQTFRQAIFLCFSFFVHIIPVKGSHIGFQMWSALCALRIISENHNDNVFKRTRDYVRNDDRALYDCQR